jgi:hypothetical protein
MEKCIEQPLARHYKARASSGALAHAATGHGSAKAHSATPPGRAAHAHAAPSAPHEEAPRSDESVVPSLAPVVPGLDSAVIPAPLFPGGQPRSLSEDDLDTLPPGAQPIDDPDGVLERF